MQFSLKKQQQGKVKPTSAFGDASDEDEERPQQPGPAQTAQQLQEAGNRAAAAGQWGAALRGFDAALAASPSSPHKLHEAKAQVWMEAGEDWNAVQAASRAVELRPDWAEGHLTLSRAQFNLGEPELSLASLERALQLQPGHPAATAEVTELRTMVLQRRASGGGAAAPQRAHVVTGGHKDGGGGGGAAPP